MQELNGRGGAQEDLKSLAKQELNGMCDPDMSNLQ